MDTKEYVIAQLSRTKNKKYEAYVIHRIISKLDDFTIKFVTQQYVSRKGKGWYLTDLYFPQIKLHVEIDESHHLTNLDVDKARERDIVNVTGNHHLIKRIDVATSNLSEINNRIDKVVLCIQSMRAKCEGFVEWNYETEYSVESYVEMGEIDATKDIALRTIAEVCNCFGHNYKGWQRGGASHPEPCTILWFPKLYENGEWDNKISDDEEKITEKNKDPGKAADHVQKHLEEEYEKRRVVFARVIGSLGDIMYRFRGVYKLNRCASKREGALIWERETTVAKTYSEWPEDKEMKCV